MAEPSVPAQPQQRAIRVFVSSTFRDMGAEREELVKRSFPQLRKLCESRGVTWGEVDLRWGVTEEQAAEGKVLPICLAEIERSRPYFIGLLGERYGWVPDEIAPELVEREPWLREHLEHSVTDLEILHGVLNEPEMAAHAFFYLRDPAYISTVSERERDDYRETDSGPAAKLAALKQRIRESGLPVREDYPDPKTLGALVLADFTALIDSLFPAGSEPDPLERQAAEHEAFARSRAGVYIGRQEYFDRLDAYAAGEEPPLVVLGESGCGKSALLANWTLSRRTVHPEELVLVHFIGASAQSSDWQAMCRRLMGELARRFEIEAEIPDQPDELRLALANFLSMAAARGRVILVIDALDQLEDREGAADLLWLPPLLPANVRLVVSTLPGRSLDEVTKRGWPTLAVEPLQEEERSELIERYLAQFTKRLSPERVKHIASAPQAANPLYLRALLEELRIFGIHEKLDERTDHYLAAQTVDELYGKILERFEEDYDYEDDRTGLVRDGMSLIWAARRGLSEAELLDLLGKGGEPLPRATWSPLYLAAEQSLVNHAGLVTFFHDYLRQAVQKRYLLIDEAQEAAHLRLADYFVGDRLAPRTVDELSWQLAQARSWQRLYDLLVDLEFLEAAWRDDEFQVKTCWARVEDKSELRLPDAYRPVLARPTNYSPSILLTVSRLLDETGHPSEALTLRALLVDYYRVLGDKAGLQASLGNQALILRARGEFDAAMALLKEQESICRELGDKAGLSLSRSNQALILRDRGELDEAMALLKEHERTSRELGDRAGLSHCLGNQALILKDRGELDEAMALLKEQERICREFGDRAGVSHSLNNQALILKNRGELDAAMALHKESERICRELGDRAGLQASLNNQALILQDRGELDEAMALHKESERICRELGDKAGLQASLGNQALILRARGELDEAMALHKESERICRELGDKAGLQASLGGQAMILQDRGELDAAMALHKEQERICRELGDRAGLQASLNNQAMILLDRGDLDAAMALLTEQERICRELGDRAGLQASFGNQALIVKARGKLDEAMALLKEQERICRELGDRVGLSNSLNNQAAILGSRGKHDEAMALLKEKERICRELGDKAGLSTCLANEAVHLAQSGRVHQALPLVEEAYEMAVGAGLTALAQEIRPILEAVRGASPDGRAKGFRSWRKPKR